MIYELSTYSKKRPYFIPNDLSYFRDHFVCHKMSDSWDIPAAKFVGKTYKAADFILWMQRAPVVSVSASEKISSLMNTTVEFLPFHSVNGRPYFVMNVLSIDESLDIFKKSPNSIVYVSEKFGEMAKECQLTGLALADPDADNGRMIVRGLDINVFPGLAR